MKATISIDPAELVISCREVIRFTGGTSCRAGDDLRSLALRMIARAAELIVPTYAYKICDIEQSARILEQAGQPAAVSCPQPSDGVRCPTAALVICTLGPQLDLEAAKLNHASAHLESLLLHGAGLAALQNLAHRATTEISELLAGQHLYPCSRLEPGCNGIELELQAAIFNEVEPLPSGVSLNEYCVMDPPKSLSFIIAFTAHKGHQRDLGHLCQTCALQDCAYRKTTSQIGQSG